MSTRFEDGPPCVPARQFGDVIDFANSLCMEIRARKLREDLAKRMRQTMRALPYQVHFGTMQQHTQHFSTFEKALEFTLDHVDDEFAPLLVGASFDAERSGLTPDEQDAR